jgi:PIN domain nuclease of toxin-antitoxin system
VLLLDTHAFIWVSDGDGRRVGRRARAAIDKAATRDALRVSAVSLFEIVALHVVGRLRLNRPVERWLDEALSMTGIRTTELGREIAIDAGFIPREALADPVDRIVAATARHLDATLMTADDAVLDYAGSSRSLRVQDLRR